MTGFPGLTSARCGITWNEADARLWLYGTEEPAKMKLVFTAHVL